MLRDAILSEDRAYRYMLTRAWLGGYSTVMCIGLNPSTADETIDDPTIRRCVAFAQSWGYERMTMFNLFAYRATDPAVLVRECRAGVDVVGAENDEHLVLGASHARVVIAAWGAHPFARERAAQVRAILPPLHCLRTTKGGAPAHPLYLPGSLTPTLWTTSACEAEAEAAALTGSVAHR